MSSVPVITVSPTITASLTNVTFASLLPQLPNGTYLQFGISASGLFPSGINYQVSVDSTGVATWSTASTTQASSANLGVAITSSGAWTGNIGSAFDCSFTYNNLAQTFRYLPQTANLDLGTPGMSRHIMTMIARAFAMDNRATLQQVFGSSMSNITDSLSNMLATRIEAMLETTLSQQKIVDAMISATGPILDLSSSGTKTLLISPIIPSLALTFNLRDITILFTFERLGVTRSFVLNGPIPCVLTMIN